MALRQITIRLAANAKIEFERYTASLGLKASELAKLLILRERHFKKLIKQKGRIPEKTRSDGRKWRTVTAGFSSLEQIADFDRYAAE